MKRPARIATPRKSVRQALPMVECTHCGWEGERAAGVECPDCDNSTRIKRK